MLDWNWYFSSLAQSAAAIVGIFGAFIISKILSNQSVFSQKKSQLNALLINSHRLKEDAALLKFTWYLEITINKKLSRIEEIWMENEGEVPFSAEQFYDRLMFSSFITRNEAIRLITDKLVTLQKEDDMEYQRQWNSQFDDDMESERQGQPQEEFTYDMWEEDGLGSEYSEEYEKYKDEREAAIYRKYRFESECEDKAKILEKDSLLGGKIPRDQFDSLNHESNLELYSVDAINEQKNLIFTLLKEIRLNIKEIRFFLDTVRGNPESSTHIKYTLLLLITLFFAGVIYPLSFLPVNNDSGPHISIDEFFPLLFSLRGGLLAVISTIFMVVTTLFFQINLSLRYRQSDVFELDEFTNLSMYSEYYGKMETNIKQQGNVEN